MDGWRRPSGGPLVSQGDQARAAGEWELAARYYRAALRAMPEASAIWVQYGHALKETGYVVEAEEAYRQALRVGADMADTHLQLGHALKLQGRTDEAAAAYLRAAALDPALRHARRELIGLGWTPARIDQTGAGGDGRRLTAAIAAFRGRRYPAADRELAQKAGALRRTRRHEGGVLTGQDKSRTHSM